MIGMCVVYLGRRAGVEHIKLNLTLTHFLGDILEPFYTVVILPHELGSNTISVVSHIRPVGTATANTVLAV